MKNPDPKNVLRKLSRYFEKNNRIEAALKKFSSELGLIPKIGAEIEFYLEREGDIEIFSKSVGLKIIKEKGRFQYEALLPPSMDVASYPFLIVSSMENIEKTAKNLRNEAIFLSKPFPLDYGSAIHFHLNFISTETGVSLDSALEPAARGLCAFAEKTLPAYLPREEDYERIKAGFDAPTHICYGFNNRTAMVRIPDAFPKRIEHRLSSPMCDPNIAIFALLKSAFLGLRDPENFLSEKKIYGLAFDPQYSLRPLPSNIYAALSSFDSGFFKGF